MKNMLSSVVASSKACGLLMVSSAPLMDRHLFTCRRTDPSLRMWRMQSQCNAVRPCSRGSGPGCTVVHGLARHDTERAAGLTPLTGRRLFTCRE